MINDKSDCVKKVFQLCLFNDQQPLPNNYLLKLTR